jgi:hypothetical protein
LEQTKQTNGSAVPAFEGLKWRMLVESETIDFDYREQIIIPFALFNLFYDYLN